MEWTRRKKRKGLVNNKHTRQNERLSHCNLYSVKEHRCTKFCNMNNLGSSMAKKKKILDRLLLNKNNEYCRNS